MSGVDEEGMAEDDGFVPEQPVLETDPSGRYSRTEQILGRGACKTVFKAFDDEEGIEIAWNRVHDYVSSKEERDRLFAEIRVLKQLKHKNIMTFYDSWLDPKTHTINFITELFTSGTLRQYRKRHKKVDPEVLKSWAWQILCGLVYLHGHTPSIIHRDLKCDNIFINGSEGVVKIGDLGLATLLKARTAPQSVLGTPEFMAPELYDEEYDDRVDIYSFGMCLLELATLEYPYCECRNAAQIYRKVTLGVRPASLQRIVDQDLTAFITKCISPRNERPRARNLLKHPYFDSIRQEKCAQKLSAEALAADGRSTADLVAEAVGSGASRSASRSSFNGSSGTGAGADVGANGNGHEAGPPSSDGTASPYAALGDAVLTAASAFEGHAASDPSSLGISVPVTGQREFLVQGRFDEATQNLQLRLRIMGDGAAKTVEFEFDLSSDTAASVASEMVEEMALSQDDAAAIASAIKSEVRLLTGMGSPMLGNGFPVQPPASRQPVLSVAADPSLVSGVPHKSPFSQPQAPSRDSSGDVPVVDEPQHELQHSSGAAQEADVLENGLGGEQDVFQPEVEEELPHEDQPVMHARQLSRMMSPGRDEISAVPIKDLFAHLQDGPSSAATAEGQAALSNGNASPHPIIKSVSSGALRLQTSPPRMPGSSSNIAQPPAEPARSAPPSAADRPNAPSPPPHRTHVTREQGTRSPPPLPRAALSSAGNTSPVLRRQISPMRKPLAPMITASSSPFEATAHLARPLSPAPLGGAPLMTHASEGYQAGDLTRQRSVAEKESRRRAAADAAMERMRNMEAQSLSGLDTFGLARGCSSRGIGMAAAKKASALGLG